MKVVDGCEGPDRGVRTAGVVQVVGLGEGRGLGIVGVVHQAGHFGESLRERRGEPPPPADQPIANPAPAERAAVEGFRASQWTA